MTLEKSFATNLVNNFVELVDIVKTLREPNGCVWDRQQTSISLAKYLIEECYEVVEAIDNVDAKNLCEELGDVLLHIVFQAQIAQENFENSFDMVDVLVGVVAKMRKRHPQIFGLETGKNLASEEKSLSWEQLKNIEKPERSNSFRGIPKSLPSLLLLEKVLQRVSCAEGTVEVAEKFVSATAASFVSEEEFALKMFALVQQAEKQGFCAESVLRELVLQFCGSTKFR